MYCYGISKHDIFKQTGAVHRYPAVKVYLAYPKKLIYLFDIADVAVDDACAAFFSAVIGFSFPLYLVIVSYLHYFIACAEYRTVAFYLAFTCRFGI